VGHHNGAFIGIDTSKLRNAIAVAEEGRGVFWSKPLGAIDILRVLASRNR